MSIAEVALREDVTTSEVPPTRGGSTRRPVRKLLHDPPAIVGMAVLVLVAFGLVVGPSLPLADPLAVDVRDRLAGFSWAHPLGTDSLGRDMLSRVIHGGRTSVALTLAVTAIVTVVGVVFGVIAGMRGGRIDGAVQRAIETFQALPLVIVAMVTVKLLGGGLISLVLVLAALQWTVHARVVRAATLTLRERSFVESSRALGSSRSRVAIRHIVPNVASPVVVIATLEVGRILLIVSTLSFLGFGARPPHPEWGSMLADARNYFFLAPRLLIIPGIAIFLVVLSANLFGEGLRDALEPRKAAS